MAVLDNTTTRADIQVTPRTITFVTSFNDEMNGLRNLMSTMRPIRKSPGTALKSKYAAVTLESGDVDEGDIIPFSQSEVKEKDLGTIEWKKFAKSVTAEAIMEHGYDDAVLLTDRQFRREIINRIQNDFFSFFSNATLTGNKSTFQAAVAECERLVREKWDSMDKGLTEIVAFASFKDAFDYMGAAEISTQTKFGMTYIENFLGVSRLFLSSRIPSGTIYATPTDNIMMYYIDMSAPDLARAGLGLTTIADVRGAPASAQSLIGYRTDGSIDRMSSVSTAAYGIRLIAEYLDGIAKVTIGGETPEPTAALTSLTIGNLTLTPTFDADTTTYTATTTDNTNAITATAASGGTVAIKVGEATLENGGRATWASGDNTVTVTVTNGTATKTYTVTVTKS